MKLLTLLFLLSTSAQAVNYIEENVHKYNWDGINVVWLEDNSLPTYDISFYFGDGALGEKREVAGVTEMMFSLLTAGTPKYSQRQLIESLEFYGAAYGSHVTHEFSDFSVSGLVKDYQPTMKMICHMFSQASFPAAQFQGHKKRLLSSIKSIVTKHGALANHIFREETLRGTGLEIPTSGKISTIKSITREALMGRLNEFNKIATKRVYIKGPKILLGLEKIIKKDCGWEISKKQRAFVKVDPPKTKKEIVFVDVPDANQAQVRIGRTMSSTEVAIGNRELKAFASKFMGGGFTSQLVQGLRVKKGLTYSASAYVSEQNSYGRSGISTFTKNETIVELLKSIEEIVNNSSQKIDKSALARGKRNIKGNYLLGLESTSDFLKNLMVFDHREIPYSEIYQFTEKINKISTKDLMAMINDTFNIHKQVILVLGNKSLIQDLKKAGYKVRRVNYKDYL